VVLLARLGVELESELELELGLFGYDSRSSRLISRSNVCCVCFICCVCLVCHVLVGRDQLIVTGGGLNRAVLDLHE
jgi:hypothetical protein